MQLGLLDHCFLKYAKVLALNQHALVEYVHKGSHVGDYQHIILMYEDPNEFLISILLACLISYILLD